MKAIRFLSLSCLIAIAFFARAQTDIIPNPVNPGNLGAVTNPFPAAYVGDLYATTLHGDGSQLTGIVTGGDAPSIDATGVPTDYVLRFEGPHGNLKGATHPNIVALSSNWHGFQYWLTFTAGTNQSSTWTPATHEDVFVYASRDLVNWVPRAPQPLVLQAWSDANIFGGMAGNSWIADPDIYYDADADLMRVIWMAFKSSGNPGGYYSNVLCAAHSADGLNWSEPVALRRWSADADGATINTNAAMAGPQIIKAHDGSLRLYAVDEGNWSNTNRLYFVSGLDSSGTNWDWGSLQQCQLTTFGSTTNAPWHFDIALVDGAYTIVYGAQGSYPGEVAYSTDGINWGFGRYGVFEYLPNPADTNGHYKAAFVPVPGNPVSYHVILAWLHNTSADKSQMGILRNFQIDPLRLAQQNADIRTNWLTIGTTPFGNFSGLLSGGPLGLQSWYHRSRSRVGGTNTGNATASIGYAGESSYAGLAFGATHLTNWNATLIRGNGVFLINHVPTNGGWQVRRHNNIRGGWGTSEGFYVGATADNTVGVGDIAAQGVIHGSGAGLTNVPSAGYITGHLTNKVLYAGPHAVISTDGDSPGQLFGQGDWRMEQVIATNFAGSGANLTNLNADNITSGTLDTARLPMRIAHNVALQWRGTAGITNLTGEESVWTNMLPGGVLGSNGLLRVTVFGRWQHSVAANPAINIHAISSGVRWWSSLVSGTATNGLWGHTLFWAVNDSNKLLTTSSTGNGAVGSGWTSYGSNWRYGSIGTETNLGLGLMLSATTTNAYAGWIESVTVEMLGTP